MSKVVSLKEYKKKKEDEEIKKEFKEFIQLLKYFVGTQVPKYEKVIVVLRQNKIMEMKNEKNEDILHELKDFDKKIEGIDNALISVLISMAPLKIVIKNPEYLNSECLITLKQVFDKKVFFTD